MSIGIGYFLQGGEIFPDMSVYENFEMGGASLKNLCSTKNLMRL